MLATGLPRIRSAGHGSREAGHLEIQRLLTRHHAARLADAAMRGDSQVVKELVASKADPNYPDETGRLPLHAASYSGSTVVVRLLLEAKGDANFAETGRQGGLPLEMAAFQGHEGVLQLLLAGAASPNASDGRGWTPLVSAAAQGHAAAARALIDWRADPALPARPATRGQPITPLMAAQEGRNLSVGRLLREALDHRPGGAAGLPSPSMARWKRFLGRCCRGICGCGGASHGAAAPPPRGVAVVPAGVGGGMQLRDLRMPPTSQRFR